MTHICVSKLVHHWFKNGLWPGWRQVIISTNDGILLTGTLGTHFSKILINIKQFSYEKMEPKISSVTWQPFCLGFCLMTASSPRLALGQERPEMWNSNSNSLISLTRPLDSLQIYFTLPQSNLWLSGNRHFIIFVYTRLSPVGFSSFFPFVYSIRSPLLLLPWPLFVYLFPVVTFNAVVICNRRVTELRWWRWKPTLMGLSRQHSMMMS